jgi:hypothetical protein
MVKTRKSFNQASPDLDAALICHGFGVQQVHHLGVTLLSQGLTLAEEGNPGHDAQTLRIATRLDKVLH